MILPDTILGSQTQASFPSIYCQMTANGAFPSRHLPHGFSLPSGNPQIATKISHDLIHTGLSIRSPKPDHQAVSHCCLRASHSTAPQVPLPATLSLGLSSGSVSTSRRASLPVLRLGSLAFNVATISEHKQVTEPLHTPPDGVFPASWVMFHRTRPLQASAPTSCPNYERLTFTLSTKSLQAPAACLNRNQHLRTARPKTPNHGPFLPPSELATSIRLFV